MSVFGQDPPPGYYQCYGCTGAVKSDPCWDGSDLNNVDIEKCEKGCFIETQVGNTDGNDFDKIERGCIEKGPGHWSVGCNKTKVGQIGPRGSLRVKLLFRLTLMALQQAKKSVIRNVSDLYAIRQKF